MKTTLVVIALLFLVFDCTQKKGKTNVHSESHTHGKSAKPNYSIVFPDNKVNRIDIKIDKKQWEKMNEDLETNLKSTPGRPERPHGKLADGENNRQGKRFGKNDHPIQPEAGKIPDPPGGPPGRDLYEPVWTYCDIAFNNQQWSKVGIRFKGNSSLRSTYQRGLQKLSFKLDFDQFEDEFPEIKNQRFYGFKQLNLKNNYDDPSFMREKVAADLFADFGLVTPQTSFCQVFIDYGEGPQYLGLYTLVEEVDDTVIKTQYKSQDGNLYKPDGFAATFAKGSFNSRAMNKKNNKKSKDFSDVQLLYEVLNSSLRIENNELWKSQLTKIFDVTIFLKWLAANSVIQNWDSYGNTFHNYYLYKNTSTNKFEWIPWDNNEAFQFGKMRGALSLSLNEVDENWPLIRYIIDDEEWRTQYETYIAVFSQTVFNPEKMHKIVTDYQNLIAKYVIGEHGEQKRYSFLKSDPDFYEAVDFLKTHVNKRHIVVQQN